MDYIGQLIPNSNGILKQRGQWFVVYIHPKSEWRNPNTPKIHWLNTKQADWKKAVYKYTYEDMDDPNPNNEVWKKDRKEFKRYRKITANVRKNQIVMSGFTLTGSNKLRSTVKKQITKWLANPQPTRPHKKQKKEPTEYTYLLTVMDIFTKYAWVFPLETHLGSEVAINLLELFSKHKPSLLQSDPGSELKNPHVNFVCKHNKVFQLFSLPQHPLGFIERFHLTFKRKMKLAILEGNMNKYNFAQMIKRLTYEYNTTIHSTTKYKPFVAHFGGNPNVIQRIYERMKMMKTKKELKYRSDLITPLSVGERVRVLSTRDPSITSMQRNQIIQAFKFKRFAQNLWTKKIFRIAKVHPSNYYTLSGFPQRFHTTELQTVKRNI